VAQRLGVVVHHQDGGRLARRAPRARRGCCGFFRRGEREREARADAGACALGPDASPVRLHQPPADDQAQAEPRGIAVTGLGVAPEQVGQPLGREAPALVRDPQCDTIALESRANFDGRGLRRVARRVTDEVVQHLHDAPRIQQVADQALHLVGPPVDDADELARLGAIEIPRGVQKRRRRALDRGQRRAKLVAHHAEALDAKALEFLERRQILDRHHDRFDLLVRADRRHVHQRPNAAPPGA